MTDVITTGPRLALTLIPALPCAPADFGRRVFAHVYVNGRHVADYRGPLTDIEDGSMSWLVGKRWIGALVSTATGRMARLIFGSHADYDAVRHGLNRHGREIIDQTEGRRHG